MRLRSLLFVPGDRPDRMAKALSLEADALILDLEDAVTPARKDEARTAIAEVLAAPRDHGVTLLVRINQLDSPFIAADLALVMRARPGRVVAEFDVAPCATRDDDFRTSQHFARLCTDASRALRAAMEDTH